MAVSKLTSYKEETSIYTRSSCPPWVSLHMYGCMRDMSTGLGQIFAAAWAVTKMSSHLIRKGEPSLQIFLGEGLQLPLLFLTHIKTQI